MNYVTLKQIRHDIWQLFTMNGVPLSCEYMCHSKKDAVEWAEKWVSSWNDVRVEVEEGEDE